jgi:hypothetical protein
MFAQIVTIETEIIMTIHRVPLSEEEAGQDVPH